MPEYPIILAHNVLDGATLAGNDITDHELERLRDGHRHTYWEAPSTAGQTITITAKNLLENPDFETDILKWWEYEAGTGAGTASRNTSSPIAGTGDLQLVVTTANDTTQVYSFITIKPIFMRADRTYRFAFQIKSNGVNKQFRYGFVDEDFTEDAATSDDSIVSGSAVGFAFDLTPAADGWYHPYIRALEAATFNADEMLCGELRDVDTLIIDGGHTLRFATIQVLYHASSGTPATVAYNTTTHYKDEPLYITFDGISALKWAVVITVSASIPETPVAKVPLMFLGQRWTMPHHFIGSFDPHQNDLMVDDEIGERGIVQRVHKYNQRIFNASMSHLTTTDYENVKHFFEDTDNGLKPFCFLWQPTTDPTDLLVLRLKGGRSVPYTSGALRQWGFDAEEVVGRRVL